MFKIFYLIFFIQDVFAFESGEHVFMVDAQKIELPGGLIQSFSADEYPYADARNTIFTALEESLHRKPVTFVYLDNIALSLGEITALAGDYFANPSNPISQNISFDELDSKILSAKKNFLINFRTITPYPNNPFYLDEDFINHGSVFLPVENDNPEKVIKNFQKKFKQELSEVADLLREDKSVQKEKIANTGFMNHFYEFLSSFNYHQYDNILLNNIDHFSKNAVISYIAGHTLALETVKNAYKKFQENDKREAHRLINLGYAYEAFAFHFLTDMFSSGHIRLERESMLNSLLRKGYTLTKIGLLANLMHNEDGFQGIEVTNKRGETWMMYGDNSYFEKKSNLNRQKISKALKASLDELNAAFSPHQVPNVHSYQALSFVPIVKENKKNPKPLFKSLGDRLFTRQFKNIFSDEYTDTTSTYQLDLMFSFLFHREYYTYDYGDISSWLKLDNIVNSRTYDVWIYCYNTETAEILQPQNTYVFLDNKESAVWMDNTEIQFYDHLFSDEMLDKQAFYYVSPEQAISIRKKCNKKMAAEKMASRVSSKTVKNIRAYYGWTSYASSYAIAPLSLVKNNKFMLLKPDAS